MFYTVARHPAPLRNPVAGGYRSEALHIMASHPLARGAQRSSVLTMGRPAGAGRLGIIDFGNGGHRGPRGGWPGLSPRRAGAGTCNSSPDVGTDPGIFSIGERVREVPIHPKLAKALKTWLEERRPGQAKKTRRCSSTGTETAVGQGCPRHHHRHRHPGRAR